MRYTRVDEFRSIPRNLAEMLSKPVALDGLNSLSFINNASSDTFAKEKASARAPCLEKF